MANQADPEPHPVPEELARLQDTRPLAFCAPGQRLTAALTLMLEGEDVSEIRETSALEGSTDVLVAQQPRFSVDFDVELAPPPSYSSVLHLRSMWAAALPPMWQPAFTITSVV